ncbi:MAG: GYF domain-containing protein [Verrucomicrobiota bacterium]
MMLYLSRAFVEFGPFPTDEMTSFYQRGLLKDSDYVRTENTDNWLHVNEWADSLPVAETPAAPAAEAPAAKKPVAKKAKPAPAPAPEPAAPVAKKPAAKKSKKAA